VTLSTEYQLVQHSSRHAESCPVFVGCILPVVHCSSRVSSTQSWQQQYGSTHVDSVWCDERTKAAVAASCQPVDVDPQWQIRLNYNTKIKHVRWRSYRYISRCQDDFQCLICGWTLQKVGFTRIVDELIGCQIWRCCRCRRWVDWRRRRRQDDDTRGRPTAERRQRKMRPCLSAIYWLRLLRCTICRAAVPTGNTEGLHGGSDSDGTSCINQSINQSILAFYSGLAYMTKS